MAKKYIDIRLHLESEVEEFGPNDTYEHFDIRSVERIKVKGIDEGQLDGLAETVAQSDHYQINLHNALFTVIAQEGEYEL